MKYIVTESQFQNVIDKFKGLFSKSKSLDFEPSSSSVLLDEKVRNIIINHFLKPDEIEDLEPGFAFMKNGKVILFTGSGSNTNWVHTSSNIIHSLASHLGTDATNACIAIKIWLKNKYNIDCKAVTPLDSIPTLELIKKINKYYR